MVGAAHHPNHDHLHVPGHSVVHGLAPEAKLAGTVAFVVAVALTPRHAVAVFALDGAVVGGVIALAGLPARVVLGRLAVITPFVAFALFLPFVGGGDSVEVGRLSLSIDGLWGAWGVVARAVLGAAASIVLAATTPIPALLRGMARLRVPAVVVAIIGFMFRYLDLLVAQTRRMRTAMVARGHDSRWLWQARPIALSAGALFVRSYERGERVHQAMTARGFTGAMPELDQRRARRRDWVRALAPAMTATVALLVVVVR